MPKGLLISRDDNSKRYKVDFTLTADAKIKKERITGTTAVGKTRYLLTVVAEDETTIPDGEYDLRPEDGTTVFSVVKSGENWIVV